MKHRKPSRIKASTSLTLAGAAAVMSLLGSPANAAPADPGAVPAAPGQQPGTTDENVIPENQKAEVVPGAKPDTSKPEKNQQQPSQPGVTTPGSPSPDTTTPKTDEKKPDATQPNGGQPAGDTPKADGGEAQPAVVTPQAPTQPKNSRPTQPGVTVPRVAPLPVPGQDTVPAVPAVVTPGQPNAETKPTVPGAQPNQQTVPGATGGGAQDPDRSTLTGQETVPQPRWQSPAVEAAPAAPVVEMTGPHTEIGANIDGGGALPGFAANTHHFSNLDGYVGTIGYTTPGGVGEAGMSLDFTQVNRIKVTAFATAGGGDDRKLEFILDSTVANAAKADVENWVRLMPGGATILDAAGQIGKLPQGDIPGQSVDVGGLTTQLGGSVQY
ncbi:hypothetical protein [Nocardia jejuensis]|uniref:hypothetical protein n=1 Tax=Nocardia jejuensis TaxID=328049 RepID=UPI000829734F|nr:hypothetical protein [Nocardia jejuensis]